MKKKLLVAIILFVIPILWSCSKRSASYESGFTDVITLSFPDGNGLRGSDFSKPIDAELRRDGTGYFSGLLGGNRGIDFITVDTNFDLVDEEALVERWISEEIIPGYVEIKFQRDPYGAHNHDSDTRDR